MRFFKFSPIAQSKKMMVTGALLAFGAVGVSANNSYADWSAQAGSGAFFTCVSNCQAGGVGHVTAGDQVKPNSTGQVSRGDIGAWPRTVIIKCKTNSGDFGMTYNVTVQDRNWVGLWNIPKSELTNPINDSSYPTC
ncbi:hypothetical protein [Streptomyces sp. NPDC005799]|uniref:hypothetical protein n=1 Tax=Streptomyces sp. NPDC005799 TaxID=3154678 RepID=UPI0033E2D7B2